MDQLFIEIIKQVPALGVLVILVRYFLNHLITNQTRSEVVIRELGDSCHSFQKEIHTDLREMVKGNKECLDRNTTALATNTAALLRHEAVHRQHYGTIRRDPDSEQKT